MVKRDTYKPEAKRFSPRWWIGWARNLFWVAVITALIWVYADLEVGDSRNFKLTVRLVSGSADHAVLPDNGAKTREVTIVAEGSRRSLDQFARWLSENPSPLVCDLSEYNPGPHEVAFSDLLERLPELANRDLTIEKTTPTHVSFRIDALLARQLPVQLDVGGGVADQVQIDPPKVTVTAASSVWDQIDRAVEEPVVKTAHQDLSKHAIGEPVKLSLALVPAIADKPVALDPKTVAVTLVVSQRTDAKAFTVPLRLLQPYEWATDRTWQEYELQQQDPLAWRAKITVTGAKKVLDKLRPEEIHAYVELTEADKQPTDSWLERAIQIRLPNGLEYQMVEPSSVQFKLVKRSERAVTP